MGESSTSLPASPQRDRTPPGITITSMPQGVLPFLDEIKKQADSERNALGFTPEGAYEDAARAGRIFVAFRVGSGGREYMGHLISGGAFPHARVFQITVLPRFRKHGVGRALLAEFVKHAEALGFMRVSARVAADLNTNRFWDRAGFPVVRCVPGGRARNRIINIRVRWLDTPTLFGNLGNNSVSSLFAYDNVPTYVLDPNVFLNPGTIPRRAEYAAKAIRAVLGAPVRVVAEERFIKELEHGHHSSPGDPLTELVHLVPTLTTPSVQIIAPVVASLKDLLLPGGATSARQESSLAHLATAIYHTADGFITGERAIIRAADIIRQHYGLMVIDADRLFEILADNSQPVDQLRGRLSGGTLQVLKSPNADILPALRSLAKEANAPEELLRIITAAAARSTGARTVVVISEGQLMAFASWTAPDAQRGVLRAWVMVDEDRAAADTAIEALFWALAKEASSAGPRLLQVLIPDACILTQERAVRIGFRRLPSQGQGQAGFERVAIGAPIAGSNWEAARETIAALGGMILPARIDDLAAPDGVQISDADGYPRRVSLAALEKFLSPAMFVYPARDGVVVPIRPEYEESLLATSPQMSLLPPQEPLLFHERMYFRTARNSALFKARAPIIFYESGAHNGRSAVIAVARIAGISVHNKRDVSPELLRRGVLEPDEIAGLTADDMIAAIRFECVMPLERQLPLEWLRERGVADGSNLVTAKRIPGHTVVEIVENGFDGSKMRSN